MESSQEPDHLQGVKHGGLRSQVLSKLFSGRFYLVLCPGKRVTPSVVMW